MHAPRWSNSYSHFILIAVFALLLEYATASSTSVKPDAKQSSPLQPREYLDDGTLNCETERSSDYYGLGVRLGIYFAWFQAWIANISVPSEISMAQDTNAVFLFAILLSMVKCTVTGLLLQPDGLLLMHFSGGTMFSVLSIWGYRTCTYDVGGPVRGIRKFGGYGTHLRLLLCTAISSYGMFFWYYGMSGSLKPNTFPGCETLYTWMFSRIRADGPIRVYYIFICIACMIYFGSMLLVSTIAIPARLSRWFNTRKRAESMARIRFRFATGLNQKQLRYIFYFLRIGNFLFIIYSMLLVEFTLNYNHIVSVLGWRGHIFFPSQIVPMIVGAFGLCRVLYFRYQQWRSPDPEYLEKPDQSVLSLDKKDIVKIYTPKSNASMEYVNKRPDGEVDPLMAGQPLWLRFLVAWLPWLSLLNWWAPEFDEKQREQGLADESPSPSSRLQSDSDPEAIHWSGDALPKPGQPFNRGTWNSDSTTVSLIHERAELPESPRNMYRFGTV